MHRDLEKDLIEIESAIKSNLERGNTFTVSVLQQAYKRLKDTQWIPCSERLPKAEQEVLVLTRRKKGDGFRYIVTSGFYEDGTVLENDSIWNWTDCNFEKYNEDEDCYIIDAGWWEYRHYNPDDVYNNIIDDEVVAWMPLPEPYKEK